jgi:dihydropyrimidinase
MITTTIHNGPTVTADLSYKSDVKFSGGKIVEIGPKLKGGTELDAIG